MKKVVSFPILVVLVFVAANFISPQVRLLLFRAGLMDEKVSIAGTGSMYPTFPKGEGNSDTIRASEVVAAPQMKVYPNGFEFFGIKLLKNPLKQGDIVEFENEQTERITEDKYGEKSGFVKRVIAVAGDRLELRDGFTYLNGSILNEPYTAKPRSTYGGDFLPDCQAMTVPEGKIFVMGDNRKASLDSRYELGLIDLSDVHYVIPWENQGKYKSLWRDSSKDDQLAHSATLTPEEFVRMLNVKRNAKKLNDLNLNNRLSVSAKARGGTMIRTNDFSTEASRSGLTLEKAVGNAGYDNIVYAEAFTRGFYEAGELIDNFFEFPETSKLLLSSKYQDIGIGAVNGEVNNCPTQIIVVHLGGYVPPNYSKEELKSWEDALNSLEKIKGVWHTYKDADGLNMEKYDEFMNILEMRITTAKTVTAKIKSHQWLTKEDRKMVDNEKSLDEKMQKLAEEIIQK